MELAQRIQNRTTFKESTTFQQQEKTIENNYIEEKTVHIVPKDTD